LKILRNRWCCCALGVQQWRNVESISTRKNP
jgi:hypothetical protein